MKTLLFLLIFNLVFNCLLFISNFISPNSFIYIFQIKVQYIIAIVINLIFTKIN